ncbi:hypothetical protein LUZ61_004295 [Rhynchospora tenuis]|uniref:Uncharacterized protein n=1 Tax=Rhynchospora tenuis TaxID=198213 RepID=A0AAD5ZML0_9POAL|nr:hypothetical protein LUZ61_004295 [Rhynchospora tenuis]
MERDSQPGPSPDDPSPEAMEAADGFFERQSRCCCFPWPKSTWERIQLGSDHAPPSQTPTRWWSRGVTAFMKIREWSELVAGPRWKTFIRRFNRNGRFGVAPAAARFGSARFQYDPLSYAMNFDEGHSASPEGDYSGYRDFSSRFAVLPGSAKSSMDLGGRDVPPLFEVPIHDR